MMDARPTPTVRLPGEIVLPVSEFAMTVTPSIVDCTWLRDGPMTIRGRTRVSLDWVATYLGEHPETILYPAIGRVARLEDPSNGRTIEGVFASFSWRRLGAGRWEVRGTIGDPPPANRDTDPDARAPGWPEFPPGDIAPLIFRDDDFAWASPDPAADARAEELLLTSLSDEQRAEYESGKAFTVAAPSGRTYRIRPARSFNVDELGRDGRVRARLCTVPAASVPMADQLLAQKLWIEADERAFRRKANRQRAGAW